jgi:carotenoid cleavage oxygenase
MTTVDRPTSNPYLVGNFAPVHDERDDDVLDVEGAIPPELDGLLLRNGPNPITMPDPAAYHWFLGDGMLHGIELSGGKARYRNRWVRTASARVELGEPPAADAPPEVNGIEAKANTHVVAHAGKIYALVESSLPTEMHADLSTVGPQTFDAQLSTPFTAHPKSDPATGELVFFGYDFFGPPFLRYHVLGPKGDLRTEPIELPSAVMMHDFGLTTSRVVWLDLPVVFDMSLVGAQPFPFTWRAENGARVGVMPRSGGNDDVTWIDIDPCYVYHPMNAYDEADGTIALDVVRYPDMFAVEVHGPGTSTYPRLERWSIDATAGTVKAEVLDDAGQEFPRVDDRIVGRPHRFGYTAEVEVAGPWKGLVGLRRHDLVGGSLERHEVGPGRAASEPVFAPAAPDSGESEGWVLSVVYDATRDSSDVIVVDPSDFTTPPVATIHLRRRVPFGFHGSWVPGASLG